MFILQWQRGRYHNFVWLQAIQALPVRVCWRKKRRKCGSTCYFCFSSCLTKPTGAEKERHDVTRHFLPHGTTVASFDPGCCWVFISFFLFQIAHVAFLLLLSQSPPPCLHENLLPDHSLLRSHTRHFRL